MGTFHLKCSNCFWKLSTKGRSDELKDLKEVVTSCKKCGKPRVFLCPNCGNKAKMIRVFK